MEPPAHPNARQRVSTPQNSQQNFYQPEAQQNFYQPQQNYVPQQQPKQQTPQFNPTSFVGNDMVANMAMQYGAGFASQGQEMVNKYIDKQGLKLYFQVDTQYWGCGIKFDCKI